MLLAAAALFACAMLIAGLLWCEQRRLRPRLMVLIARDHVRHRDCSILIAWGLRAGQQPLGHGWYDRSIELSWDWKPTLFYKHCYDRSRLWTGRHRQLLAWSWFVMLHVRGPRPYLWWAF